MQDKTTDDRDRQAQLLQNYLHERSEPCPSCGYDLRSLTGHACPECGELLRLRVGLCCVTTRRRGLTEGSWKSRGARSFNPCFCSKRLLALLIPNEKHIRSNDNHNDE